MFHIIIINNINLFPGNAQVWGPFSVFSYSTNRLAGGVPFVVPNDPLSHVRESGIG